MGKIRIKQIGDLTLEGQQKEEVKKRQQAKKIKKEKKKTTKAPGLKGGERVVAMGPSEEELAKKIEKSKETKEEPEKKAQAKKPSITKKKRQRSKRYLKTKSLVEQGKAYPIKDAVSLLKKISNTNFTSRVEAHINLDSKYQNLRNAVELPHGTGKNLRVAIAGDALLEKVKKGKIEFDVLLASPSMMLKVASVAKILGPKNLMPNPKAGTVVEDPKKKAAEYSQNQLQYKTESKVPIIHTVFGRTDFDTKKLEENLIAIIKAIDKNKIKKLVIKSTMSPAIKVQVN